MDSLQDFDSPVEAGFTSPIEAGASRRSLPTDNRYKAWGESRYASGTLPMKFTYPGQYSNVADFGLLYYGSRWYVAVLNGLAGGIVAGVADLIPGGSQVSDFADRWMSVANDPATRPSLSNASKMAVGGLAVHGLEQLPRAAITNYITHYWQQKKEPQ